MRKLAIFVEGFTELRFVDALMTEIAGAHKVLIEHRKIRGGVNVSRKVTTIKATKSGEDRQYYVLIFDCGGDSQVKTRILEEHESLTNAGYSLIIGLRDVRPSYSHAEVPRLEQGLRMYVKTSLTPVRFVLSVMEIEAWFLAETTHFQRVSSAIDCQTILKNLGFDPATDDLSQRSEPSRDLDECYQLGGKNYEKANVASTVAALDFSEIYLRTRTRFPHLGQLVALIDEFLGKE